MDEPAKHDAYAALRISDFRKFITARFFLTVGIQIQSVIVGWQIYSVTKDPLSLGLIGLTEALPFICIALFAGHVADVISRKKIIIISASALALCTFLLFSFTLNSSHILNEYGTLPIYAVIFLTGIARSFLAPSFFAFLAQLVPREQFSNAATWNSTTWHIGAITGPALGGLLYGFTGITNAYATDAIIITCAVILFSFIRHRPLEKREKKEKVFASVGEGIRFVFRNQVMLGAMSLDLFAVLFGGAVALLPVFADQILHVGPKGLGFLRAAPAVGAVLISLVMAHRPPTRKAGRNLLLAVAGFGLCIIGFALSRNYFLSLFLLALSGAFDNVSVVVRSTILQMMTPDSMRGRVSAVNSIFIGSSNEIGEFESGVAARLLGLVNSVVFGGSMTILVVLVTAKFAPLLRRLNLVQWEKESK